MKRIGFLFLFCNLVFLGAERVAAKDALHDLRDHLFDIMKSEDSTLYYISQLDPESGPVSRAYFGALQACMARHVFFPVKKWNYFVEGREQLDLAVKESPWSVEVRFLRLVIQSKAPSWLGYSSDANSDLRFIRDELEKDSCSERALLPAIATNLITLELLDTEDKELKMLLTKNASQ